MKKIDLKGQRFGRLTVVEEAPSVKSPCGSSRTQWKCKCDCGSEIVVGRTHLLHGDTTSCGCYRKEVTLTRVFRHGFRHTRLYNLWCSMKERCSSHGTEAEIYYARGIRVCDEWKYDFLAFREWALNNGYDEAAPRGTTTIDRIDNNGNYEPSNCRFISLKEQARNKTNTLRDTINGVTKPRTEWCEIYNADRALVYERMRRGWSIERALTTPPRKLRKRG